MEPPNDMLEPGLEDTPRDTAEDTPKNVLPFRPVGEAKSPVLTPVENSAFNELARQLSARLDSENGAAAAPAYPGRAASRRRCAGSPRGARGPRASTMAGATRGAGARRDKARQGAARSGSGRRADLPARPAALCQRGVPRTDGLCEPSRAGGRRRSRRALCRARRLQRQQHLGHRHAGDDFRVAGFIRTRAVGGGAGAPLHDFLGR